MSNYLQNVKRQADELDRVTKRLKVKMHIAQALINITGKTDDLAPELELKQMKIQLAAQEAYAKVLMDIEFNLI